jgi:transposase
MPAKIPKPIREQVIKQWLQGISRDQIAKDNDVGAGTV